MGLISRVSSRTYRDIYERVDYRHSTMSDVYKKSKMGRLKLKTPEDIKKRKKKEKKAKKRKLAEEREDNKRDDCAIIRLDHTEDPAWIEDRNNHGGWWKAAKVEDIRELCVIEFEEHEYCYVHSLDDGTFTIGSRQPGRPPLPQEQLTPIPINESRFALKTGFGRYVTVEKDGLLRGCMEAYGPNETFEPVFQDGKCALQAVGVNCFLSFNDNEQLVAVDKAAKEAHMLNIRCVRDKKAEMKKAKLNMMPKEEHGTLAEAERNYARKFQSWVGGSLLLSGEDKSKLKKARTEGNLHSEMLIRRQKMKNDKYCK